MQAKKIVIASIFVALMSGLSVIFPTSTKVNTSDMIKTTGTVEAIFVSDKRDLVVKLKNDDRVYYVDNGRDNRWTFNTLKDYLPGKPVEIYSAKPSLSV